MMQNSKILRIDFPQSQIKAENVENVQINSFVSYQKRQKLQDLEQCLQRSLKLKNSIIVKLQLEKSDWMKKVKELENYITDLKTDKEDSNEGSKEKIEDFKSIYEEKLKLLQLDNETLIKSVTNKFEDICKLKSKVKKWKSKYSTLDKRKKELADLNEEKDKTIIVKNKTCDELTKIVQEIKMENFKTEVEESKLLTKKVSQLNEEQKQDAKNIEDLLEKNKELLKNIKDLEEKMQTLKRENDDLIHLSEVQNQNLCKEKEENSKLMEDLEEAKIKITSSVEKKTSQSSLVIQKLWKTLEDYKAELSGLTKAKHEEDKRKSETITRLQKKCSENEILQKEQDETINSLQEVNKNLEEKPNISINGVLDKNSLDVERKRELNSIVAEVPYSTSNENSHQNLDEVPKSTTEEAASAEMPMLQISTTKENNSGQENDVDEDKETFNCPEEGCLKCFKSKATLFAHKNIHTNKFRCKQKCKLGFKNQRDLTGHDCKRVLKRRTLEKDPERPVYICEACSKPFASKVSLKIHRHLHTDRYACSYCKQRFDGSFRLNQHLKDPSRCQKYLQSQVDKACDKEVAQHINAQDEIKGDEEKAADFEKASDKDAHHNETEDYIKDDDFVLVNCEICGKFFVNENNLLSHKLKCSKI